MSSIISARSGFVLHSSKGAIVESSQITPTSDGPLLLLSATSPSHRFRPLSLFLFRSFSRLEVSLDSISMASLLRSPLLARPMPCTRLPAILPRVRHSSTAHRGLATTVEPTSKKMRMIILGAPGELCCCPTPAFTADPQPTFVSQERAKELKARGCSRVSSARSSYTRSMLIRPLLVQNGTSRLSAWEICCVARLNRERLWVAERRR